MNKLNIKAFGLAAGIIWSGATFFLGLMVMFLNWGTGWENVMATLYIGYKPTFLGCIIGAVWGFFDGGIGGVIFAWLYNKLAK